MSGSEGHVTALATNTIAVRALVLWAIGLIGTGWIAGYLESLPRREQSRWAVVAFIVLQIPLSLGPIGVGLIADRSTEHLSAVAAVTAVSASAIVSLWLSSIGVQIVQNAACRFFGTETRSIQWWSGGRAKRSGRRKRRSNRKMTDVS